VGRNCSGSDGTHLEIQMSDFASSIGIVAINLSWNIMLTVLVTAGLIGLSLGWLKRYLE